MAIPAISKIREIHKDKEFILITNRSAKVNHVTAWDVLKHTGYFKDVIYYNTSDIKGLLKLALQLRNFSKNILYYLTPVRSRVQAIRDYIFFKFICSIDKIFCVEDSIQKYIVRDKDGNLIKVENEFERLLKIIYKVHKLDYKKNNIQFPLLFPPKEAYEKISNLLKDSFTEDKIFIAIGHGSKIPATKWDLNRFKKLCNLLLNFDERISLVIFGGENDFKSGEYLREGFEKRSINLCGKTNIIESAAAISKCVLFVGNDSGPLHLAASMGIPCVGIYSARDNPGRWEPYGNNHIVLRENVECEGCFLEECIVNKMKCLYMITAEEVFLAVVHKFNYIDWHNELS